MSKMAAENLANKVLNHRLMIKLGSFISPLRRKDEKTVRYGSNRLENGTLHLMLSHVHYGLKRVENGTLDFILTHVRHGSKWL